MNLANDLLDGASEIAIYLGRPRRTVYWMIASGFLPVTRAGRRIYARKSEIDRAFSADKPTI